MNNKLGAMLLFCLCSIAELVHATGSISFSNLRFTTGRIGEPGVLAVVTYVCFDSAWDGMTFTLAREGNTLTATIPNSEAFPCFGVPPPTSGSFIPLGTLAPGDYQFILQEASATPGDLPIPLIAGPFTVTADGPFSNPRIRPNPARSGRPVDLRLLATCAHGYDHGIPTILRHGSVVRIYFNVVLEHCLGGGPAPLPENLDLRFGSFEPGTYTLTVHQWTSRPDIVVLPLETTFVVNGEDEPIPVPINSMASLITLLAILLIHGSLRLNRQHKN